MGVFWRRWRLGSPWCSPTGRGGGRRLQKAPVNKQIVALLLSGAVGMGEKTMPRISVSEFSTIDGRPNFRPRLTIAPPTVGLGGSAPRPATPLMPRSLDLVDRRRELRDALLDDDAKRGRGLGV